MVAEVLQSSPLLILVLVSMDLVVVLLVLPVQVVVVLELLDNHIHQLANQDGVVQECRHHPYSEILQ